MALPNSRSCCDGLRTPDDRPISSARGWRGQVPRQPGQVRKEAATTSPTWVDVQPLTLTTATARRVVYDCTNNTSGRDALINFRFPRQFGAAKGGRSEFQMREKF